MNYNILDTIDLYNEITNKEIILIYEGVFNRVTTNNIISIAENHLDYIGELPAVKRKIVNILIECLQNISKHKTICKDIDFIEAIFIFGKNKDSYFITSGNLIDKKYQQDLETKLKHINKLDSNQLKELYKEVLKNGKINEKGGASLGLMDMIRKSGHKLEYHFEDISEKYTFFILRTNI